MKWISVFMDISFFSLFISCTVPMFPPFPFFSSLLSLLFSLENCYALVVDTGFATCSLLTIRRVREREREGGWEWEREGEREWVRGRGYFPYKECVACLGDESRTGGSQTPQQHSYGFTHTSTHTYSCSLALTQSHILTLNIKIDCLRLSPDEEVCGW